MTYDRSCVSTILSKIVGCHQSTEYCSPFKHLCKFAQRHKIKRLRVQLFQCLKDHNNNSIREMLNVSNVYCYENASGGSTDDDSDSEEIDEFHPKHVPTSPCVFTVVDHQGYFDAINTALDKLESDGLVLQRSLAPAHSSNVRSV